MKKVLGLSLAMMLAIPTVSAFAESNEGAVEETQASKTTQQLEVGVGGLLSKTDLKSIKEQASYSVKKVGTDEINSAIFFVDGVEVEVFMGDKEQVTDDMIQKAASHVKSVNGQATSTQTMTTTLTAPTVGTFANENPGGASTYGTPKKHTWLAESTVNAVRSTITYGFGSIAAAAGSRLGVKGAAAAGVVGAAVGGTIGGYVKPLYTTSKFMRSYSSYYGYYLVDFYCTIYTNSARTKVLKVYLEYDVKSSSSVIGYS